MRRGPAASIAAAVASAAVVASCGEAAPPAPPAPTAPAPTTAPAPRPALAASQLGPLTVHGSGFRALERVRVSVTAAGRARSRTTAADRRGRFVVRFDVALPRCGSVLVRAIGRQGSRATLELPRPDCREP